MDSHYEIAIDSFTNELKIYILYLQSQKLTLLIFKLIFYIQGLFSNDSNTALSGSQTASSEAVSRKMFDKVVEHKLKTLKTIEFFILFFLFYILFSNTSPLNFLFFLGCSVLHFPPRFSIFFFFYYISFYYYFYFPRSSEYSIRDELYFINNYKKSFNYAPCY